ncbi:MAG: tyrosine-type recombinase/integrase [Bacilli bacterium]
MNIQHTVCYRKKNNGWQFVINYKVDNKWKQTAKQGFRTKKEAQLASEKYWNEFKKKIGKNKIKNINSDTITLEELYVSFIKHISLYRSQNTLEGYKYSYNKFKSLKNLSVANITKAHIQKCVDEFTEKGIKSSSIETYLKKFKQILLHYKDNYDSAYKLPIEGIVLAKKIAPDKKALNKKEINIMLKDFKSNHLQYYPFILLCVSCGLRRGEALGVTWNDIDKKNRTLTINKQWKKLKDGSWGFGDTKNGKHRKVPISDFVFKELEEIHSTAAIIDINNRITLHSGMFISQSVNKYLKPYGITIHELRHTYITNLIANGADFKTVADLVGDTVRMIYDTYSHVNSDMLNKTTKIINNIF